MNPFSNHNVSIHPETKEVLYGIHSGYNVYWTINSVGPSFDPSRTPKPSKADITASRFAHVDIDPSPGWDKAAVLTDLIEQGATVVVDSGYGLQGLWAVVCPVPEVEAINRGLIARFGADRGTWNADRLFRVPGYTNYPNAKKRAEGRVESMAALLWSDGPEWTSEQLRALFPEPAPAAPSAPEIDLGPWQVETVESLGLDAPLAEMVATTAPDRSSHAMAIAARMARAQYTNEQIMGLLMNPDYPWSGTIQEQADPERQAARKVRDAAALRPDMDALFPPVAGVAVEPPRVTKMREDGLEQRNGKMMFVDEQLEHFKGCTYIEELDAVLCPDWVVRKQPQFNKHYGGHRFIFSLDGVSGSQLTKSAWEAFTENAAFRAPTVQRTCFRPEHEPRAIIRGSGVRMINTWRGLNSASKEGDASPFVNHVRKLLPVGDDADMLLSYMAYCVQNPGMKVQWWPVIQGCPGNGKSMLLNIIRYCLGEEHYHEPDTAKMVRNGIDFNAWVVGCLFVGMEEVYASNRREFLEGFKRYVTNYSLTIRPMYGAEYTGDNRANGMVLTNHRDGVPIDDVERRYAPFFTAQQSRADMIRDGMGGSYFPDLWAWLRADGYAIVNHFLKTHAFNTEWVLSAVAPVTSSTREAVSASLGRAEQEVMESIEQGEPGFAGGWVSSIMLDRLLDAKRVVVPRNKRKEMMEKLGYEMHPGLTNGRCSSVVMPDGGKPRLYVTVGHLSLNATKPSEVERLYTEAQSRAAANVAQSRLGA